MIESTTVGSTAATVETSAGSEYNNVFAKPEAIQILSEVELLH
jgi:hypothetical protein